MIDGVRRLILAMRADVGPGGCVVTDLPHDPDVESTVRNMATVVLRARLMGGDRMDVTFEEPDADTEEEVIDNVISILAQDAGVLRCRHGDRLVVLYGRGVAALEVAPRGAVL
ncbi:hypothetical protein [Actinoplanes sp. NPDC005259]|uniref:hypothetical protein n=1 Tax=Actinoplanes sp. NPDC005259 TaxID=3154674 RepID=UPI0033A668A6